MVPNGGSEQRMEKEWAPFTRTRTQVLSPGSTTGDPAERPSARIAHGAIPEGITCSLRLDHQKLDADRNRRIDLKFD